MKTLIKTASDMAREFGDWNNRYVPNNVDHKQKDYHKYILPILQEPSKSIFHHILLKERESSI